MPADRHRIDDGLVGVGEVGGPLGEHDVVDEGGCGGELVGAQHGAGTHVDDTGVAGGAAGDEEPAAPVGLQAQRRGADRRADHGAGAGDEVGPVDAAVGAGAEVRERARPGRDPLRLEAVGQVDRGRQRGGLRTVRGVRRCGHQRRRHRDGQDGCDAQVFRHVVVYPEFSRSRSCAGRCGPRRPAAAPGTAAPARCARPARRSARPGSAGAAAPGPRRCRG